MIRRYFQWVKQRGVPLIPRRKERGQEMWFRFANEDVELTANGLFVHHTQDFGPWLKNNFHRGHWPNHRPPQAGLAYSL